MFGTKITKMLPSSMSATLQGYKQLCSTTTGGFHALFKANFFVKSVCKGFPLPFSLNRLSRLSFQPVFSLGSLPGKQKTHLNQWKNVPHGVREQCLPFTLQFCKSIKHHNHISWRPQIEHEYEYEIRSTM